MTLYFQRRDSGLQISYLAQADGKNPHLQIVNTLRLYGITMLDAPEIENDITVAHPRIMHEQEPELTSITRYFDCIRYSSVNLPAQHTQCIIEASRRKNEQDLVVSIYSWLDMSQEKLRRLLERTVIDDLSKNGIKEIASSKNKIPLRYLDPSKPFTSSLDSLLR